MKNLFQFIMLCAIALSISACSSKETSTENTTTSNEEVSTDDAQINIYYFHFTRRCITCNAIETETQASMKSFFPQDVANGNIKFVSINLDEDSSKPIAEELQVSNQTLLFKRGSKKIDLTNDAFMYAKDSPEKLREKIKETIETLKQ